MNSALLFIIFCISLRLLIAWGAATISPEYLNIYSIGLLLIGLSFLYLYFTNTRLNAPEGGGVTWWADYRLIIGVLYLAAAIYGFKKKQNLIWIPLVLDVTFGIWIFFWNRTKSS
jgi:hypothetical protein